MDETAESALAQEAEATVTDEVVREEGEKKSRQADDTYSNISGYSFSDKILHDNWPSILWIFLNSIDNPQDRDKIILATIGFVSGIIGGASYVDGKRAGVYGCYQNRIVYANLYLALYGPPATNKGELADIGHIADPIQTEMEEKYAQQIQQYLIDKADYDAENKGKSKAERGVPPVEPQRQKVLIGGNVTAAALKQQMATNGGWGILLDTELDGASAMLKSESNSFSTVLRQCAHHETVDSPRATYYIPPIVSPRLSVLLTGTEG